jgi:hypothetical protein
MNLMDQLWALADDVAASGRTIGELFGECGLFLVRPLVRWEYFCTPLNTLTFASTGGDGVHYGLLPTAGVPYDQLPVVMTVPMSDRNNIVVAETLKEFLGLGYFVGWFSLEQLSYDPDWALSYFSQPDPDTWPEREEELRLIRDELAINYAALSLNRIQALNDRYLSSLVLPG